MAGRSPSALVVHDVVEVCADLVAALAELDYRKRHFCLYDIQNFEVYKSAYNSFEDSSIESRFKSFNKSSKQIS